MVKASSQKIRAFQRTLVQWYRHHQRNLPWRHTRDPYAILVSEVMLQQTQVDRVIPKYRAWLTRFPTVHHLAHATPRDVLLAWAGMGYNRRAVYLHRAANDILQQYDGIVPTDPAQLVTLPGVGAYTAAAVATFSTGTPRPLVDTNVRRVLLRVFVGARQRKREQTGTFLARLAGATMLRRTLGGVHAGHWWHTLMDFGALVCRARPRCEICPMKERCRAYPEIARQRVTTRAHRPRALQPTTHNLQARQHPDRIYYPMKTMGGSP